MNVLFVGKWDIAGAYIADAVIREGNTACWMTDDEEGVLWNKKLKGNVYRGAWHREDFLKILKANSVDTIVYMTSIFRENGEELPEYESQMMELTDLLNVLRNYPVKSLVYLSSLELEYEEAHTPAQTELVAGEMLCEAYHRAYEIPVLTIRMGCVFGAFGMEHMGYTGWVLQKMKSGKSLRSRYAPGEYLDLIYGGDLAKAVYRLLKTGKQGDYRIMTGHPVSMREYYACLSEVADYSQPVIWLEQKKTAPQEYFLSDNRVKLETGWMPYTLFSEKGKNVLAKAYKKGKREIHTTPKDTSRKIRTWFAEHQYVKAVLETLALYVLCQFLVGRSSDMSDLKYVDIRLMFVVLVSCLHGVKMGVLAVVLASLSYISSLLQAHVDISYLLYSVDTWIPFAAYLTAGAVVGYIVDRRKDDEESLQENYKLLTDKYEFLKSIHGETLEVKKSLQQQIITSKYSFGRAYEMTIELDSLKPELIILKVIRILENIMDCKKAAVFLVNSKSMRYARLKACSTELGRELPASVNMEQYPLIYEQFRENRMFVNTGLEEGYPDFAAPVYYRDEIFGFAAVYDIGAEHFTVYYQNLFKIVISLIEKNLAKALEYEHVQHEKLYFPGTELLYPQVFEEKISIMSSGSEEISHTFVKAKVYPMTEMSQQQVSETIASVIRSNDYMGIDRSGDYAVVLVNMAREYLPMLESRFRSKNLCLEAEETQ